MVATWRTSVFTCVRTVISNFTIFFIIQNNCLQTFSCKCDSFFFFDQHMIQALCLLMVSFFSKLIVLILCSFQCSQNFYACFFSISLIADVVDIEQPHRIYSPTFVVDSFSGLFLNPSIFLIKDSRYAQIRSGTLYRFVVLNSNNFFPSLGIPTQCNSSLIQFDSFCSKK